ncbi:hypothetical protein B9Z55_008600 [Caenorhabditis nigoni]|uniref:RING-type domain-containing protein n=1 Tax=Caenorhabditis nigoni TaxID=1611254 RepID=A0A2G5UP88_9PELO|nr:hypothetical protein B9Z55_008600 [Caenorhabditis nigoni]
MRITQFCVRSVDNPLIIKILFIKNYYEIQKKKLPIRLLVLIIDFRLIITLISVSHQLDYSENRLSAITELIIWYTVIFLWAFLEFFSILVNGIKLSNQEEEYEAVEEGEGRINEDQGTVPLEGIPEDENLENVEINQTLPTCNICLLNYSNPTVVPLILIGCGHTVCQKCVRKIPRHQDNTILCPFCRQPTYYDDQENQLPKNYAILEMIEKLFFK